MIPQEHIEEILSLKEWLASLTRGLPQGDDRTRYLFEIYNTYLNRTNREEYETCSSCRSKVLFRINDFIQNYERTNLE